MHTQKGKESTLREMSSTSNRKPKKINIPSLKRNTRRMRIPSKRHPTDTEERIFKGLETAVTRIDSHTPRRSHRQSHWHQTQKGLTLFSWISEGDGFQEEHFKWSTKSLDKGLVCYRNLSHASKESWEMSGEIWHFLSIYHVVRDIDVIYSSDLKTGWMLWCWQHLCHPFDNSDIFGEQRLYHIPLFPYPANPPRSVRGHISKVF